jgi:hypothetical protein
MKYSKPEVLVVGDATCVIEKTGTKVNGSISDPPLAALNPAYDLDE